MPGLHERLFKHIQVGFQKTKPGDGDMMEEEERHHVAKPNASLLCCVTVQLTSWTRPRAKVLSWPCSDWSSVNWPLWSLHLTPSPSPRRPQPRSKVICAIPSLQIRHSLWFDRKRKEIMR